MSFEATKNLTGARQLVKLIEWESVPMRSVICCTILTVYSTRSEMRSVHA